MVAFSTGSPSRRLSLHAGVLGAVAAICLLVVGLDAWRTWQARAIAITAGKVETENLARSLAQHAHDTVQAADSTLVGLRERIEVDGGLAAGVERLHQVMALSVASLPVIHDVFVLDREGGLLVNSRAGGPKAVHYEDRAYFQAHRRDPDRGVRIGLPVHSKVDGSWILTVSRRVDAPDGTFGGVVLATISIDFLQRFYQTFDVGARGVISLASIDGIVIARVPEAPGAPGAIGADVSGGGIVRELLPYAPLGSFHYVSPLDGVDRFGSFRRVADYPLYTVVARGADEMLADWRADAYRHFGVSLSAAAALGFLGSRFARQISSRQQAERRYRLLADNSSDAIVCIGHAGRALYVSPALATLTGWGVEDSMARDWVSLVHADDQAGLLDVLDRLRAGAAPMTCSFRYVRRDGSPLWVEAHIHLAEGNNASQASFVASIRDITERKAAEDQVAALNRELTIQANTDALTGLANRRRFDEAITQEWRRAARDGTTLSLLMIDVDRFKLYNDQYGHQQGDHCLHAVATAIAECARRPADVAARYGGEEFALLLPGTNAAGAAQLAERVRAAVAALAQAHAGNPPALVVTASVGAATLAPRPADDIKGIEALVGASDAALYEAKRLGRNRIVCQAEMSHSA